MEIAETEIIPREMLAASGTRDWNAGSAEPWIADVLSALLIANNTKVAVEIGGFEGYTSKRLLRALAHVPGFTKLIVCEIDPKRADAVQRLLDRELQTIYFDPHEGEAAAHVVCDDSLRWIPTLADGSVDFVWLDGNHEKAHVTQEIALLLPKLAPGGLLCGHDVFGVCDLAEVFRHFGGYALDFPMLGPAGGIGIIQRPR